jgi:hypothetical protein
MRSELKIVYSSGEGAYIFYIVADNISFITFSFQKKKGQATIKKIKIRSDVRASVKPRSWLGFILVLFFLILLFDVGFLLNFII